MQTVVIEVDEKRYQGLSSTGKSHYIMLSTYNHPHRTCIFIPVSVVKEVNTTDDPKLVKFVVKEWWYRKNPTMLGMHTLRDIIDRYPERIKATNSHLTDVGFVG